MEVPQPSCEVLRLTFAHLQMRRLLEVRQVCRRWRDVALHRSLWSHRQLTISDADRGSPVALYTTVLQVAPCLRRLRISDRALRMMDEATQPATCTNSIGVALLALRLRDAAITTRCAVEELILSAQRGDTVSLAARILRQQSALGGLRHAELLLSAARRGEQLACPLPLLEALRDVRAPELSVHVLGDCCRTRRHSVWYDEERASDRSPAAAETGGPVKTVNFIGSSDESAGHLLEHLLEAHAQSLEVLRMSRDFFHRQKLPSAAVLKSCPVLRELCCPLYEQDLGELLSVTQLSAMILRMSSSTGGAVSSFFTSACHLKRLCLESDDDFFASPEEPKLALDYVIMLSSSGQSALESLRLVRLKLEEVSDWKRLAAALPGLPLLNRLELLDGKGEPPRDFFKALTPQSVPQLQVLHLGVQLTCPGTQEDSAEEGGDDRNASPSLASSPDLFLREVQTATRRVPWLHVVGLSLASKCDKERCDCWEKLGLRHLPLNVDLQVCGHGPTDHCDFCSESSTWLRLGEPAEVPELSCDAVLKLMAQLNMLTLLRVRLVCRRWAEIALHPSLWRHRKVSIKLFGDVPLASQVLRLAPTLRSLTIEEDILSRMDAAVDEGRSGVPLMRLSDVLLVGRCAVRELSLAVMGCKSSRAAQILRNQSALGQLTRLTLRLRHVKEGQESALLALLMALRDARVRELSLKLTLFPVPVWPEAAFDYSATGDGHLRKLVYDCWYESGDDRLLKSLLEIHAASLEVVHLKFPLTELELPVDLLSCCHNLQELHCPLAVDMDPLMYCVDLTSINVTIRLTDPDDDRMCSAIYAAASSLLQSPLVSRLKHLTIENDDDDYIIVPLAYLELLSALSASGQSVLESLTFARMEWDTEENWMKLADVLAGMPRLASLKVNDIYCNPPASFFRALRRCHALTRLKRLCLTVDLRCPVDPKEAAAADADVPAGEDCGTTMFLREVRRTLRRFPGLHVSGISAEGCAKADCDCWQRLGPPELRDDLPMAGVFVVHDLAPYGKCEYCTGSGTVVRLASLEY